MQKKIIYIFTIVYLINSTTLFSQSNYFPLEIGNYWIYDNKTKVEVVDTTTVYNRQYYVVKNSLHSVSYYRLDSSGVLIGYNEGYSRERIIADFSLNVGDTLWPYSNIYDSTGNRGIFITQKRKNDTVSTPFGTFENCYMFEENVWSGVDYEQYSWYSENVGLVQYSKYGGKISITEAQIGGVLLNADDGIDLKPSEFMITGIYPNPFNPTATIKYTIPKPGNIKIRIYNITGELVKEIEYINKHAGNYIQIWNSDNKYGEKVSSGIYLVQVNYNSQIQTKKIILLK